MTQPKEKKRQQLQDAVGVCHPELVPFYPGTGALTQHSHWSPHLHSVPPSRPPPSQQLRSFPCLELLGVDVTLPLSLRVGNVPIFHQILSPGSLQASHPLDEEIKS